SRARTREKAANRITVPVRMVRRIADRLRSVRRRIGGPPWREEPSFASRVCGIGQYDNDHSTPPKLEGQEKTPSRAGSSLPHLLPKHRSRPDNTPQTDARSQTSL